MNAVTKADRDSASTEELQAAGEVFDKVLSISKSNPHAQPKQPKRKWYAGVAETWRNFRRWCHVVTNIDTLLRTLETSQNIATANTVAALSRVQIVERELDELTYDEIYGLADCVTDNVERQLEQLDMRDQIRDVLDDYDFTDAINEARADEDEREEIDERILAYVETDEFNERVCSIIMERLSR